MEMTITEWLLMFAILDGPVMGMIYLLWRRFRNETK
tara:strand:+ start:2142 stop:2249 length:108 start_codon:yes stop_codon:yes gene_type:complete